MTETAGGASMDGTPVESDHAKCPSCGAEMAYSPESGKLVCPYCGHEEDAGARGGAVASHDYDGAEQTPPPGGEGVLIHCDNCGANIAAESSTAAQLCPFCGSPMSVRAQGGFEQPDAVLPVRVDREKALACFQSWVRSRFFSPGKLRTMARMEQLGGVYLPHFLFDCRTASPYTAQAGTHYYVTEWVTVERDGRQVQEERQVQRTRWEFVSGEYDTAFYNRVVNASKNVDRKLMRLHFDFTRLLPYAKDYLYGFLAENCSISRADCWEQAKREITEALSTEIRDSIRADEVADLSFTTRYSGVRYKLALLPVWISAYRYRGKTYKFIITGDTGETRGQAPLSAARILLSILLTLGVPAGIYQLNRTAGVAAFVAAVIVLLILASRKPKPLR